MLSMTVRVDEGSRKDAWVVTPAPLLQSVQVVRCADDPDVWIDDHGHSYLEGQDVFDERDAAVQAVLGGLIKRVFAMKDVQRQIVETAESLNRAFTEGHDGQSD